MSQDNIDSNQYIAANLKILALMVEANKTIQHPKIRLCNEFTLQLAGSRSQYKGSINITDGKPYDSNIWYGRINTNGSITYPRGQSEATAISLETELLNFASNPAEYATLYGKLTSSCMFCGKSLTNQQSIAVGYGPICAGKYGLPYGELSRLEAQQGSFAEFDLEPLVDSEPTQTLLDKQYIIQATTRDEFILKLEAKLKELKAGTY